MPDVGSNLGCQIITDYVRTRKGRVFSRVCDSVHKMSSIVGGGGVGKQSEEVWVIGGLTDYGRYCLVMLMGECLLWTLFLSKD